MSIRSPKNAHRGWVLRSVGSNVRAKALTFTEEGEVALSWYKTNRLAPTVLVEDIPSAVRASKTMNSVALLGTGIGSDRAMEIAKHATRPIFIAMDQDATPTAIEYAKKYCLLWDDVRVMQLPKDMKNMSEPELLVLLNQNKKRTLNERETSIIECDPVAGGI